jgi:hypothetical protein
MDIYKVSALARLLLFLAIIVKVAPSSAQSEPKAFDIPLLEPVIVDTTHLPYTYKFSYIGLGTIQFRDQFLSPVLYTGYNFQLDNQKVTYSFNRVKVWRNMTDVSVSTNGVNSSNAVTLRFNVGYSQMFKIQRASTGNTRLFIGPDVRLHLHANLHEGNQNNVLGYNAGLPLGLNTLFEHGFTFLNRRMMVSNNFSVPLVSIVTRNPYSHTFPDVSEDGFSVNEIIQIGSWNTFFYLENRLSLDFYLRKRKSRKIVAHVPYRLSYYWNYSQMNQPNELRTGIHTLSFTKVLRNKF